MSPDEFGPEFDLIHERLGLERPPLGGDWEEKDG